jgi:hypothetical protein
MHLAEIPAPVTVGYVGGVAAFALWRGGPRERLIGTLQLLMLVNWGVLNIFHWDVPAIFINFVELVACLACTVRSRSYWTIWASAAFLVMLATRVVHEWTPRIGYWAFLSADLVWLYVATASLAWGALVWRRTERGRSRSRPADLTAESRVTASAWR